MMAWDTVQKKLQCCGIDGPRNWFEKNETKEGMKLIFFCKSVFKCGFSNEHIYSQSCSRKLLPPTIY